MSIRKRRSEWLEYFQEAPNIRQKLFERKRIHVKPEQSEEKSEISKNHEKE